MSLLKHLGTPNPSALACLAFTLIPALAFGQITLSPGDDVQAAVDRNPPGTTFALNGGIFRLQMVRPKDGDTFVGTPGTTLSGAALLTDFGREGALWVVYNQGQQGQLNGFCDNRHPRCAYPEDLYFDDRPLLHVADLGSVGPGAWFFDYANQKIYFADDPTGHKVEVSVMRSAFSGSASNVAISTLVIEKYAVPGQFGAIGDQYPGPNWLVINDELRWNHGTGINLGDGGQAIGNFVHDNGQKGIGAGGQNVLVQGNQISFNNWAGFDPAWDSGGAKFAQTNGLVVRGNFVHDNAGPGLWSDVDSINTLYENNTVVNNVGGAGIQYEVSYAATIRNNVVRNNSVGNSSWMWGAQILLQNSRDVAVYGNTVEVASDRGNGIGIIQQYRGDGAYGPHIAANNSIVNNSIIHRQSPQGVNGEVSDYDETGLLQYQSNIFDFNAYHVTDPTAWHWRWNGYQDWGGMHAVGQELHGTIDSNLPPAQ